jgi:DNA-binding MarR family transcriptional regulator
MIHEELGRQLMDRVRTLVRRFSLVERADVACCGMTVAQAATLEALHREGSTRLGALGQRLGIQNSTMTRNLGRLKDRGLVKTEADPTDGRAVLVVLTDDGIEAARRVAEVEHEFARSIADALGTQGARDTLTALDGLLTVVHGASQSCCPGAFDHLMTPGPTAEGRMEPHGQEKHD